jgi:hypothetical protein
MIVAAAASFIMGLCGYILWRFTVQPIWRYRSLKRHIGAAVAAPGASTEPHGRLADEITALYHGGLPQWYRLVLRRRNEDPLEAAKHLAGLINPGPQAARTRRVQQIRRHLGLEESR